jgi:hypothetical protein
MKTKQKLQVMNNSIFDAHCHIFTFEFAIKEVKHIVYDMLRGTYPLIETSKSVENIKDEYKWKRIKELLRCFFDLINSAGISEQENMNFLQREAVKSWPCMRIRIIPIMVDIFYILSYSMEKDTRFNPHFKEKEINAAEFQEVWDDILDDLMGYIRDQSLEQSNARIIDSILRIEVAKLYIEKERNVSDIISHKSRILRSKSHSNYYQTNGFRFHFFGSTTILVDKVLTLHEKTELHF